MVARGKKNHRKKKTGEKTKFISLGTVLKYIFVMCLIIGTAAAAVAVWIAKSYIESAPALNLDRIENQSETSFIYDQDGQLITEYYNYENRVWVPIEEIPKMLQDAFIAIEDERFRDHKGVDIRRIGGALFNNLTGGHTQGASTITQQLIKNCLLSPEQSFKRKIQEAYLALKLETQYSKDQVLEAYLNTIYLAQSNYGVKAAAMDYFGKEDLKDLTLKECAILAAITKNPAKFDPRKNWYDPKRSKDTTLSRANLVLDKMLELGFITQQEYQKARLENVQIKKESTRSKLYDMAPFVEYALYEVRDELIRMNGWGYDEEGIQKAEEYMLTNGLKIYTTVDRDVQKAVEDTLYNWDRYPKLANEEDNEINAGGTVIPQPQAAAVVVDYRTGQIKAIVGGRKPPQVRRELNRAVSPLMVGSSIKPLSVYGPALENGRSPASIYHNIPVPIEGWDKVQKFPQNYGGGGYSGPISMREALKKSLNVVAAQVLTYDVGLEKSKSYLTEMGIEENHIQVNGSGLALGTSAITPVEMASAFGTIANGGIYIEPISVLKVLDRDGKVIIDRTQSQIKRRVFQESTAWLLTDMLQDAVENGTGQNARIPGMNVAGKTGTATDYRGVFFAGYTPYYSAVVWIGHDWAKPLYSGAQGGKDAAPLWQAFMEKIHRQKELPNKPIIDADPTGLGLIKISVCSKSGNLPSEHCPEEDIITDWFLVDQVPQEKCRNHQVIELCKESGKFITQYCPRELVEQKNVFIVEADSPYRQLSEEELKKWLPGAYTEFGSIEEIQALDPDDPKEAGYFCNIHTREKLIDEAKEKVEKWYDILRRLLGLRK